MHIQQRHWPNLHLICNPGNMFPDLCSQPVYIRWSRICEFFVSCTLVCCLKLQSLCSINLIPVVANEADYLYRPFRQEWMSMALVDHSAFYLSLANAALFTMQMMEHKGFEYGECLNQVARRLSSRIESVSEGIITTVLGFICHDVCLS
jgi:hypothetical protein